MNFKLFKVCSLVLMVAAVFVNCDRNRLSNELMKSVDKADVDLQTASKQQLAGPFLSGELRVVAMSTQLCNDKGCSSGEKQLFSSKQSIKFSKDGNVSGQSACNSFGGKYKINSGATNEVTAAIVFQGLMATEAACQDLDEEQALFEALGTAYLISDATNTQDTVYIYSKTTSKNLQIHTALELKRLKVVTPVDPTPPPVTHPIAPVPPPVTHPIAPVPPPVSVFSSYQVIAYIKNCNADRGNEGTCTNNNYIFKSKQSLLLQKNGKYNGQAACNNFAGSFKITLHDGTPWHAIKFGIAMSTERACSLLNEEVLLVTVLSQGYQISNTAGPVVYLKTQNGLLELRRK